MASIFYVDDHWATSSTMTVDLHLHGLWNSTVVFDGARSIRRMVPDLLRHCERMVAAAPSLLLESPIDAKAMARIAMEGVAKFPAEAELYIRPMLYGVGEKLYPPEGTRFMLQVQEVPLKRGGFAATTRSAFRRPSPGTLPTHCKAGWLYQHALIEINRVRQLGFDEAVMLDPEGRVVEFARSNLFWVKDGVVHTPKPNGSFLAGVTRRRVLELLRADGIQVVERNMTPEEIPEADEIFAAGNMAKIRPMLRLDDRHYQRGPVSTRVHELYWNFAAGYSLEHEIAQSH